MLLIAASHVSGPVKGVFQLMENVDRAEVEIHLYDYQYNEGGGNALLDAVRERGIPVSLLVQRNRSYLSLSRQVVREIRNNGFDIIQTHGFKSTFLAFVARLFCRVKWICFMHGATSENLKVGFYNLVDGILQRGADRTVLVSEAQRRRILGGRDRRRVVVLHNAVDLDRPMPISHAVVPLRERLRLAGSSRVLVTVGRFSPEKGMDVLLDAFSQVVHAVRNVHVVLVGDGQERQRLEAQVSKLRLDDQVHFVGYSVTPGDFMAEADVFVLPSRSEGSPNAVLEAMAMGKPVVATAVGGVPEIIEDGVNGRLVPPQRPDLLALSLVEVLCNPQLQRQFAREGKRCVQQSFSVQARVDRLQALYRDVVNGSKCCVRE